jgi:hypothetical protein
MGRGTEAGALVAGADWPGTPLPRLRSPVLGFGPWAPGDPADPRPPQRSPAPARPVDL